MNSLFIRIIKKASIGVAGFSIIAMMVIIFVEVILRSFFSSSLRCSDELSGYLLGYAIYWGAIYSIDRGSFLRIDILHDRFPEKVIKVIDWINDLLFAIFIGFCTWFCFTSIQGAIKHNTLTNTFYRWPVAMVRTPFFIGMALLFVYLVYRVIYNSVTMFTKNKSEEGGETK